MRSRLFAAKKNPCRRMKKRARMQRAPRIESLEKRQLLTGVTISVDDIEANEDDGTATFTVSLSQCKRPVNYIRAIGNGAVRQVGRLEVKFVVGPGYAVGHAAGGVAGDEREVFIGFAEILLEITRRLWCLASAVGDGSLKPLQVHGVDGDSQQLQLLGGTEQIDAEPFGVAANHVLSCEGCQPLLGGLQSVGPVHSFSRGGKASFFFFDLAIPACGIRRPRRPAAFYD